MSPGTGGWPVAGAWQGLEPLSAILTLARDCAPGSKVRVPQPLQAQRNFPALMDAAGFERAVTDGDGESCWTRRGEPGWGIRWITPADARDVCRLHEIVFRSGFDLPLWEWRYGGGRGCGLGAWVDGELVGHIGLMRRRMCWEGVWLELAQMGDLMVHPAHRGGLRGWQYRLFTLLAIGVCGGGGGVDRIFGFPRYETFRLSRRQGLQRHAGRLVEYYWSAEPRLRPEGSCRPLVLPKDASVVDGLWEWMRQERAQDLVGERTAAYLQWRYVEHPGRRYVLRLVRDRWLGRAIGVLVFRVDAGRLLLMDLVGRVDSIPILIAWARWTAGVMGASQVSFWGVEDHPAWARLAVGGQYTGGSMQVSVTTGENGRQPDPTWDAVWWLTAGDIDHL